MRIFVTFIGSFLIGNTANAEGRLLFDLKEFEELNRLKNDKSLFYTALDEKHSSQVHEFYYSQLRMIGLEYKKSYKPGEELKSMMDGFDREYFLDRLIQKKLNQKRPLEF
ncbi:MAG: hypothetical protein ACPGJV_00740 [Bacteriovoracaceae bacterium]